MTNEPLPVTYTDRFRNMSTGRMDTWGATAPGWRFVRTDERGTPWYAEATDLHLIHPFGTLKAARYAAANGLRQQMIDLARDTAYLTGTLASHHAAAQYACACGGLLVDAGDRGMRHLDGCTECAAVWTPGEDDPRRGDAATRGCCPPCRNADNHILCGDPRPVGCRRCEQPAPIAACASCGRDYCCGCCSND